MSLSVSLWLVLHSSITITGLALHQLRFQPLTLHLKFELDSGSGYFIDNSHSFFVRGGFARWSGCIDIGLVLSSVRRTGLRRWVYTAPLMSLEVFEHALLRHYDFSYDEKPVNCLKKVKSGWETFEATDTDAETGCVLFCLWNGV